MRNYKMTYALYWEVEVVAEDEEDAYILGKDQIPDMTVGCDDWLLCGSEYEDIDKEFFNRITNNLLGETNA
jgi:hypothetical protein